MSGDPISAKTVIRAIGDLTDRTGQGPTTEDLAKYLECAAGDLRPALLSLRSQRIYRQRQRQGRKVWLRWSDG